MRAAWLLSTVLSSLLLLIVATQLVLGLFNAPQSLIVSSDYHFVLMIALGLSLVVSLLGLRCQWGAIPLGLVLGTIVGIGAPVLSISDSVLFAVPSIVTGVVAGIAIDVIGWPIGPGRLYQWLRGSQEYGIDQPGRPKLTIWYLMAFSTCAAVYFGVHTAIIRHVDPNNAIKIDVSASDILPHALSPLFTGIEFAGFILWASRQWRRYHFPFYPGEYVWIILGFRVAQQLIPSTTSWPLIVLSVTLSMAQLGFAVLAITRIRQWNWRLFFVTLVIFTVLRPYFLGLLYRFNGSVVLSYYAPFVLLELIVVMTLQFSVMRDYAKGIRSPWPHWAGIIALLLRNVAGLNVLIAGLIESLTTTAT